MLVLVVPLLHWTFLATGVRGAGYYAAYGLLGACGALGLLVGRVRDLQMSPLVGLLGALALSTLATPLAGKGGPGLQLKALAVTGLWLSGLWTVQLLSNGPDAARSVSRALRWLGLTYSLTIVIAFLLFARTGLAFGEVAEDVAGRVRVFGPAGDQAAYVVAAFLVRAVAVWNPLEALLHLGALLLTGTRGAVFAAVVGVCATAWLLRRTGLRASPSIPRTVGGLAALGLGAGWLLHSLGGTIVARSASLEALGGSAIERLGSIQLGWLVFADRPWLGFGFNGFREAVWAHDVPGYFLRPAEHLTALAANQVIQVAADGGIVGLAFLAWFFAWLLRPALQQARALPIAERRHLVALQAMVIAGVGGNQLSIYLNADSSAGYLLMLAAGGAAAAVRGNRSWADGDVTKERSGS